MPLDKQSDEILQAATQTKDKVYETRINEQLKEEGVIGKGSMVAIEANTKLA